MKVCFDFKNDSFSCMPRPTLLKSRFMAISILVILSVVSVIISLFSLFAILRALASSQSSQQTAIVKVTGDLRQDLSDRLNEKFMLINKSCEALGYFSWSVDVKLAE